jgi:hypothetical protein
VAELSVELSVDIAQLQVFADQVRAITSRSEETEFDLTLGALHAIRGFADDLPVYGGDTAAIAAIASDGEMSANELRLTLASISTQGHARLPSGTDGVGSLMRTRLDELRRAAERLAPMNINDVANVTGTFMIAPAHLAPFEHRLREIYSQAQAQGLPPHAAVRRMFGRYAPPTDLDGFATVATRARIDADAMRVFQAVTRQPLDRLLGMPANLLMRLARGTLGPLRAAASRLAPMSMADVYRVTREFGIETTDLWVFGPALAQIYARRGTADPIAQVRQTLARYTDLDDIGTFAAVASATQMNANAMYAVADHAWRTQRQNLADLRQLDPEHIRALAQSLAGPPAAHNATSNKRPAPDDEQATEPPAKRPRADEDTEPQAGPDASTHAPVSPAYGDLDGGPDDDMATDEPESRTPEAHTGTREGRSPHGPVAPRQPSPDFGPFARAAGPSHVTVGGGDGELAEVPPELNSFWFGGTTLRPAARTNIVAWVRTARAANWRVTVHMDQASLDANADFIAAHLSGEGVAAELVTRETFDPGPAEGLFPPSPQWELFEFALAQGALTMAADIARYAVLRRGGGHADVDLHPNGVELPREPLLMPTGENAVPFLAPMLRDQRDLEMARIHFALRGRHLNGPELVEQAARLNYEYGRFNTNFILTPPGLPLLNRIYESLPERLGDQVPTPQVELKKYTAYYTGPLLWDEAISAVGRAERTRIRRLLREGHEVPTTIRPRVDPRLLARFAGLGWVTPESDHQEVGTAAAFHDETRWDDLLANAPVDRREHTWPDPASGEEVMSAFDVRRAELDGERVTELTVAIDFRPDADVRPEEVDDVRRRLHLAVHDFFNAPGYRLPDGDLLRVKVVAARDHGHAHLTVDLHSYGDAITQHSWVIGQEGALYAHELAHQLGLRDEYGRASRDLGGFKLTVHRTADVSGSLPGRFNAPAEEGLSQAGLRDRHLALLDALINGYRGPSLAAGHQDDADDARSGPAGVPPTDGPMPKDGHDAPDGERPARTPGTTRGRLAAAASAGDTEAVPPSPVENVRTTANDVSAAPPSARADRTVPTAFFDAVPRPASPGERGRPEPAPAAPSSDVPVPVTASWQGSSHSRPNVPGGPVFCVEVIVLEAGSGTEC